jgi:hypothetical protein
MHLAEFQILQARFQCLAWSQPMGIILSSSSEYVAHFSLCLCLILKNLKDKHFSEKDNTVTPTCNWFKMHPAVGGIQHA